MTLDAIQPADLCCCGHFWIDHDPSVCTGKRCSCRGYHDREAPKAVHMALDSERSLHA